jgi:hypothetical protein
MTTSKENDMLRFKKSLTGKWAIFGPATEMRVGDVVEVSKSDGTTTLKKIRSTSEKFDVDGVPHAYGFVGDCDICPSCRDAEVPRDGESVTCPVCTLEALGLLV